MSEFHVRVVEIGAVEKHSNADSLSITTIGGEGGYPCILRTGEFLPGDKAVYVPVGAVVPAGDPRWAFLGDHREIEAKKLRGIFSMGLLTAADPTWEIGRDVASDLGITRAEPAEPVEGDEPDPGLMPCYTDIEGLRAHPGIFQDGEEIVITEKIHGENARYCYSADNGRLYCGSRTRWKNPDAGSAWWVTGCALDLAARLASSPTIGIFGELYGNVSGMKYDGTAGDRRLRIFDAMDLAQRRYLDFDDFVKVAASLDLPTAPILYRGPWGNHLREMAEGNSTFADHVREGIVIKPVRERFDPTIGRVILKLHGSGYLLGAWKKKGKKP